MSDTKNCPFCGEEIQEIAIKCKHCKSELSSSSIHAAHNPRVSTPEVIHESVAKEPPSKVADRVIFWGIGAIMLGGAYFFGVGTLGDTFDDLGFGTCDRLWTNSSNTISTFEIYRNDPDVRVTAFQNAILTERLPESDYQLTSNLNTSNQDPDASCAGDVILTTGESFRGAIYRWEFSEGGEEFEYIAIEPIE